MMLAIKAGPQIAAKVGNPAGLLSRRIWYSVGKSGVLGITEYRQGRPLLLQYADDTGAIVQFADTINILSYHSALYCLSKVHVSPLIVHITLEQPLG